MAEQIDEEAEAVVPRSVMELAWRIAGKREAEGDAERAEAERLRALLTQVTVAASRLIDGWAEGDEGRRHDLWRGLAKAVTAAEDDVYPLTGASLIGGEPQP